jgi:CBS domain-containing protein
MGDFSREKSGACPSNSVVAPQPEGTFLESSRRSLTSRATESENAMDQISLPRVDGRTSVRDALAALRRSNARAVVVVDNNDASLLLNRDLIYAALYDVQHCKDVRGAHPVATIDVRTPGDIGPTNLDDANRRFGMQRHEMMNAAPAMVTVVTRTETLKQAIVALGALCLCGGPKRHVFDSPPERDGVACPSGDGSTLECA